MKEAVAVEDIVPVFLFLFLLLFLFLFLVLLGNLREIGLRRKEGVARRGEKGKGRVVKHKRKFGKKGKEKTRNIKINAYVLYTYNPNPSIKEKKKNYKLNKSTKKMITKPGEE